ncbi:hypothetical protein HH214_18020 [Mucilaginibacter robiniae]|uniref:Uncharacterized protein n=1 Tax=Mucilaginibacter robiniae TaxID=2728022 RepID=A0A7L5E4V3_9SPHI|nr:hypothetical protein [Mucilaginibacter robiniae]QJD97638.1 hypothetical protein HH214_18020 [Mucilaginibacter robiniae]
MYTLITAASRAEAYQLKKNINSASVLLGDYADLPELMLKSGKMLNLPNPQQDTYPHQMLAFCLDHQIETVYLLRPEEAQALAPAHQLFTEYGIELITAL